VGKSPLGGAGWGRGEEGVTGFGAGFFCFVFFCTVASSGGDNDTR
jgi:hypothetical protein